MAVNTMMPMNLSRCCHKEEARERDENQECKLKVQTKPLLENPSKSDPESEHELS